MKSRLFAMVLLAGALLAPLTASAADLRAFVKEFTVNAPEAATLKPAMQNLFSSRIAGDGIVLVGNPAEADVVFTGSYTQLGKSFSLDAMANLPSGNVLATAFDQGESLEGLIPAMGKVSQKLKADTLKAYLQKQMPAAPPKEASVARPAQGAATAWLSPRIGGTLASLAPGRVSDGAKEFFAATDHSVRLYRQNDKNLTLLAEAKTEIREKVISVESTGPDANGNPRVYVSIMDGESPASRIYSYEKGTLTLVAKKLPYLFRAIALYGGESRIYAQQAGRNEDFYGDVYELDEAADGRFQLKNPIKLPRNANIYTFNMLRDSAGKNYFVVLTESGYIALYSPEYEELWRSTDTFGGSENYFQRESPSNVKITGEAFRLRFLEQRITVTANGELLVPQNKGFFVLGNSRSYSNYSIVSFAWNGVTLDERWRSKPVTNYLADYFFDQKSQDLVELEVVQREGMFSKGGSAVRVIRAE
jgi:hypothetical protein